MIMHALVAELFRSSMSVLKMSSGFINEREIVFCFMCRRLCQGYEFGPFKNKAGQKERVFFSMIFRKHFELTVKS